MVDDKVPNHIMRPVPDPTALTTAQLYREITGLRDLMDIQHTAQAAMDKERMERIELRFNMVEAARLEQKEDQRRALESALAAAERAVTEQAENLEISTKKSETAFDRRLEQLAVQFNTSIGSLSDKATDNKDRIARVEAIKEGGKEANSNIVTVFGLILTLLLIVDLIVTFVFYTR